MVVYILFYILIGVWQITQTHESQATTEVQQSELENSLTVNSSCSEYNCSYRNNSECKNEKGWNLYGSDWGCCGNYEGCCLMASKLCYIHDKICKCCRLGWLLCGPECQPEPYCSNYKATTGKKGRKWLLHKIHKDYVIGKTQEFQKRLRYNISVEDFDAENGTDLNIQTRIKTDTVNNSDSGISRHLGKHIYDYYPNYEVQDNKTSINSSFMKYDIHNSVQNKTEETTTLRMPVTPKVRNNSAINHKPSWTETGSGFPGSFKKNRTMQNSVHQAGTKSYTGNYPIKQGMKKNGQKNKMSLSNEDYSETKNDGIQKDSSKETNIFDNIFHFFFSKHPSKTAVQSNDPQQKQNNIENYEGSGEVEY